MNTVFARALLALGLVVLPASALASSPSSRTSVKHSHTVAKKEATPKKKGKHHGHKSNGSKSVASTPAKPNVAAKAAPAEPAVADSSPKVQ